MNNTALSATHMVNISLRDPGGGEILSYYEIIVTDFAGNTVKKKLTSQYSLLSWFHTSIDRSSHR